MESRALENLKLKTAGLLNNCMLSNSNIVRGEDWERVKNLAGLISKLKKEWINERQAEGLVVNAINKEISKSQSVSGLNGRLSDFIDSCELAEYIVDRVIGLPYVYSIYYELPNFLVPDNNLDISYNVRLETLSDRFVKGESLASRLGIQLDTESCFFCVEVNGYCDHDPSGETPQESLKIFKTFVERGKASDVLWENFFLRFSSAKTASQYIYCHEHNSGAVRNIVRCSISKDVSEVLTSLQLMPKLADAVSANEIIANGMSDFKKLTRSNDLSLARIVAACEWSFDADAEQIPAMKVVKACIGLESVYGDDNSEGGLTKSLSDRCGYSLATSVIERKVIMRRCRELYRLRSSIVHGVKRKLSSEDMDLLHFGMAVLTGSIGKEIELVPDGDILI